MADMFDDAEEQEAEEQEAEEQEAEEQEAEEQEAERRNAYLREVHGPLQSYALWRPSDIDITTCHAWWKCVRDEPNNTTILE